MAKNYRRERGTVIYPRHAFEPEDLLRFIQLRTFERDWKDLRLDDDDLFGLEVAIMLNPKGPPVVPGAGGLRKIRFAPARSGKGKSGGLRVGYAYLEDYGTVLLIVAYGKNEKDDLNPDEKKAISGLIAQIEKEFAAGIIK